jgi:hypothetical protein
MRRRQAALVGSAPGASPGTDGATEVIEATPQACSCGKAECPDTRSCDTHQVIVLSEIQMTVSPLLPLQPVRDARVSWQVPQPWSLWQALMAPEDRT